MKKEKNTRKFIDAFIALSCVFTAIAVVFGQTFAEFISSTDTDVSAVPEKTEKIIVIDAGHGGEDGGAVATDGTVEKDLNLRYSKNLYIICEMLGIKAVLTRDTDTLLYDKYSDLHDYTGKKKVYDLKNRLRFTNETGDGAIFVSIHMNKFPDPKYNGTQIYFSPNNPDSVKLASSVQVKVKEALQPENDRSTKKSGSSIFLLHRLDVPSILIECGFLSNEYETTMLKSSEYQKEFSLTTAVAIGEFTNSYN